MVFISKMSSRPFAIAVLAAFGTPLHRPISNLLLEALRFGADPHGIGRRDNPIVWSISRFGFQEGAVWTGVTGFATVMADNVSFEGGPLVGIDPATHRVETSVVCLGFTEDIRKWRQWGVA